MGVFVRRSALIRNVQSWLVAGTDWQQISGTVLVCALVGIVVGALFAFLGFIKAPAVLVALAAGLLMLRSMRLSLTVTVAVIFLLPYGAVPMPDIGFTPTFLDVTLAVLIIVWLFRLAGKKQDRVIASPLGIPLVLFMTLACLSFIIGLAYGPLTTNLLRHFAEFILALLLVFLIANNVQGPEQVGQVLAIIILAGLATAALGLVLYFLPQNLTIRLLSALRVFRYPTGSEVLRYVEDDSSLPMRATSSAIDPNSLGGLLLLATALTTPQLLTPDPLPIFSRALRWRGINWLVAPVWLTMAVCLLLTYSRSAMLGLGVAGVLLVLLRYRRFLLLLLVAALLVLLLPPTQYYLQHLLEGLQGQDLATQMRLGEYKDALVLISRYPLFGVGFAGAPDIDTYIGVSSVYLLMAEEMGLAGLVTFLVVIGLAISQMVRGLRALSSQPRHESVTLGLLTAIVGALCTSVLDHYFFNINFQPTVTLFWLCVGLGVSSAQPLPVGKQQPYARQADLSYNPSGASPQTKGGLNGTGYQDHAAC
jgi:polysaccharide biosynthesis protein PslJ